MISSFVESGMDFTPLFNNSDYKSFYIEKSIDYQMLNKKSNGVKSVEFLSKKGNSFYFIEAKETFADVEKADNLEKVQSDFQDLYDKFHHSFLLFISKELKIKSASTDFAFLNQNMLQNHKIKFYLIIKDSEKMWCKKIEDKLKRDIFKPLCILLNLEIHVIPSEVAKKFKIIT